MKYRITAVRVAGAEPRFEDRVLSTTTFYRRHQKIMTVGNAKISIRNVPVLINRVIERIVNGLQEATK